MAAALENRHQQSSFCSWIERTWNSLGGPACVDAAGYENAHTYFRMLEEVSADGIDATGEAMREKLSRLYAVPDPSVSDRCGVQLMTIHKAKGLGFDVVVLPGLQKSGARDSQKLICSLERSNEIETELLVAPIGGKEKERSSIYRWVERQRRNREIEEHKRLFYVACTRAREELHLFGTATVTNGRLSPGQDSLLDTAWPALQEIFQKKYLETQATSSHAEVLDFPAQPIAEPSAPGVLDTLAAEGGKTILRRLPFGARLSPSGSNLAWKAQEKPTTPTEEDGGRSGQQALRSTRILGTAVHALFELAAGYLDRDAPEADLRGALPRLKAHAQALVQSEGFPTQQAEAIARDAVQALERAIADPVGLWILSPHQDARCESSWTGVIEGVPRTLRIDRSFLAGAEPLGQGADFLWIIDYKTAALGSSGLAEFLEDEKLLYAEQLQSYAQIMRLLHGDGLQLRLGLYYPFLQKLNLLPDREALIKSR